jgi:hypothetical protein
MFKADLDSNYDQHELERGIKYEGGDEKVAKERAKDNLKVNPKHYSDLPRNELDDTVNKDKNQTMVGPSESVEGAPKFGRGGQDATGPGRKMWRGPRSGKQGPGGGDDKSREYWDMDRTGKKPGFMSIQPPKENIYPASEDEAEAARTFEDFRDIETIFPKDYNPEWEDGGPTIGPSTKHRNKRPARLDPGLNPFPGSDGPPHERYLKADEDIHQKQVQQLIPNQKLAIAVDPNGRPGERIVILQPMFEEVSPAIQALRSQRFEKHGAVVVDGPPFWLLSLEPKLEAMDKGASLENANSLYGQILQLAQQAGLTVDYTQEPRA